MRLGCLENAYKCLYHWLQVRGNLRAPRAEVFDLVCKNLEQEFGELTSHPSRRDAVVAWHFMQKIRATTGG